MTDQLFKYAGYSVTETGQTIEANSLKILKDGIMLESQSCIFSTVGDIWNEVDLKSAASLRFTLLGSYHTT